MKIHWGRIVIGGFLTEAIIIAGFLALLLATRLAGAPTIALPETPIDFTNAIVSSLVVTFACTLWVCRPVEAHHVVHGLLVGVTAILIFVGLTGAEPEPILYIVAHGLKLVGGAAGGMVAAKRRRVAQPEGAPV
jgi:hypothetical protein